MKIHEIKEKSMKIHEINENPWNQWKSLKIHENHPGLRSMGAYSAPKWSKDDKNSWHGGKQPNCKRKQQIRINKAALRRWLEQCASHQVAVAGNMPGGWGRQPGRPTQHLGGTEWSHFCNQAEHWGNVQTWTYERISDLPLVTWNLPLHH